MKYGIMEYTVDDESSQETVKYRDQRLDGGAGVDALRLGSWLVPIGGFLLLAAMVALLAAPSGGAAAARSGAIVGLLASTILMVGAVALLIGYTDQAELTASTLEGRSDIQFDGNDLAAGAIWLGAAIVLGFGGSVLGFSDKSVPAQPAREKLS